MNLNDLSVVEKRDALFEIELDGGNVVADDEEEGYAMLCVFMFVAAISRFTSVCQVSVCPSFCTITQR